MALLGLLRIRARAVQDRQYTAASVRRWMREDLDTPQAQAVRAQIERMAAFVHEPKVRAQFRGMESYYHRIPSILSMYLRGLSIEEIADYYRPVFTGYGVEHTLDILAQCIADRLNKGA